MSVYVLCINSGNYKEFGNYKVIFGPRLSFQCSKFAFAQEKLHTFISNTCFQNILAKSWRGLQQAQAAT